MLDRLLLKSNQKFKRNLEIIELWFLDVCFVYISLFLNMPEEHTGMLNPGIIVWEVACFIICF